MNTIAIIFLAFAPGVFVVTTVCAAALLCRRFDKRDADVAAVCDRRYIRFTLYLPALVAIAGCGILSGAFGLIELDARCQSAWLELRRRVEGHQSAIGNRQS
jgi:hypothetical protein